MRDSHNSQPEGRPHNVSHNINERDYESTPCTRCKYTLFMRISHKLLKSESLNPKDSVCMEACTRCGLSRECVV